MSTVVNPLDPRRRGRAGFGTLTAGMVLRGAVPAQVLYANRPAIAAAPGSICDIPAVADLPLDLAPPAPEPATAPVAASPQPAAPVSQAKGRRAMTVRLDPVHHMRLRVVSSYLKCTSQQIIVAALDAYFAGLPATVPGNCACLAAALKPATK